MGSLSSKLRSSALTSAKNSARKYPTRTIPSVSTTETFSKSVGDLEINDSGLKELRDSRYLGKDISLDERLQQLGPVDSQPKLDTSSVFKTTTTHLRSPNLSSNVSSFGTPVPSQTNSETTKIGKTKTTYYSSHVHSENSSSSSIPVPAFTDTNFRTNPAITLLARRSHMDAEAEAEFACIGKSAHKGRRFLAVEIVRQIIYLRDTERMESEEIERRLGLSSRVVGLLGRRGIVGVAE